MIPPPQKFFLPFLKKEKLAQDTYALYFDKKNSDFTFSAGNYVRVTLDFPSEDPRGKYRSFSVASPPSNKDTLMIITHGKEIQSPYKQKMLSLTKGEEVTFWGPMGIFLLPEKIESPICLLAGGVGLAPFYSMLTTIAAEKLPYKITLIASFRTQEEVFFLEELAKHTISNAQIEIVYTVTQHKEGEIIWEGEKERISEAIIKKYIFSPKETLYYLCGSVPMVEGVTQTLLDMDIPYEQIIRELFTGY